MSASVRELAPEVATLPPEQQTRLRKIADRLDPLSPLKPTQAEEYARSLEGMLKAASNARAAGFTVIEGTPNTLLIDLDGTTELQEEVLKLVSDLLKEIPTMSLWKSKDGVGTHVVLRFERTTFTECEAIALEASLGSDLKRAAMAVMRLKNGVPQPRVLFKPPLWQEVVV